jgi:predicted RNA-binding Zn ribbon-like protein
VDISRQSGRKWDHMIGCGNADSNRISHRK